MKARIGRGGGCDHRKNKWKMSANSQALLVTLLYNTTVQHYCTRLLYKTTACKTTACNTPFCRLQGWTADDYEVGGKGKAADFDESIASTATAAAAAAAADASNGFVTKPTQKSGKTPSPASNVSTAAINGTIVSSVPSTAKVRNSSAQEKEPAKETVGGAVNGRGGSKVGTSATKISEDMASKGKHALSRV